MKMKEKKKVSSPELRTTQKVVMALKYHPEKYLLIQTVSSRPQQTEELLGNEKE
jgi:hypothetical protein